MRNGLGTQGDGGLAQDLRHDKVGEVRAELVELEDVGRLAVLALAVPIAVHELRVLDGVHNVGLDQRDLAGELERGNLEGAEGGVLGGDGDERTEEMRKGEEGRAIRRIPRRFEGGGGRRERTQGW